MCIDDPDDQQHRGKRRSNNGLDRAGQVEQFFVDSCVSGKPKPVLGDPTFTPTNAPASASTPTASSAGSANR
jgi:hypothetical protein